MKKTKGWEIHEEALRFHYLNKEWLPAAEVEALLNDISEYLMEYAPDKVLIDITEIMQKHGVETSE